MAPQKHLVTLRLKVLLTLLLATLLIGLVVTKFSVTDILPYPRTCSPELPNWIDEVATLAQEQGYPGFQFSYLGKDGHRFDCSGGWAKKSFWPETMSVSHRMRYASLTKIFTSTVLAQLIGSKSISPDDKLLKHLRLSHFRDERLADISISHLATHVAGFDRALSGDPMMTSTPWCPGAVGNVVNIRLDHTPGSHFSYSNLGYCLLGVVISKTEQLPLDKIFQKRLFQPIGITEIKPLLTNADSPNEATPHFAPGESQENLTHLDFGSMLATGAWVGNASGFLIFLEHTFGKSTDLIYYDQQRWLLSPAPTKCDIGTLRGCHGNAFYHYHPQNGAYMYWRDGSLPGSTAFSAIFDDGSALVFLANSRPTNWLSSNNKLGQRLYQIFGSRN